MLVALVLKALVDNPSALIDEIMRIMRNKQDHPVITQMASPGVEDDLPILQFADTASSSSLGLTQRTTQPPGRFVTLRTRGKCQLWKTQNKDALSRGNCFSCHNTATNQQTSNIGDL